MLEGVSADREERRTSRPGADNAWGGGLVWWRPGAFSASPLQRTGTTLPVIDRIASSPYVRAVQTAEILADTLGFKQEIEIVEALTPENPSEALLPWLATHPPESTVAIVGHEPHLSRLVTWLMTQEAESHVVFKKGGACLLDLGVRPSGGGALLHWLLTPGQLRSIAD